MKSDKFVPLDRAITMGRLMRAAGRKGRKMKRLQIETNPPMSKYKIDLKELEIFTTHLVQPNARAASQALKRALGAKPGDLSLENDELFTWDFSRGIEAVRKGLAFQAQLMVHCPDETKLTADQLKVHRECQAQALAGALLDLLCGVDAEGKNVKLLMMYGMLTGSMRANANVTYKFDRWNQKIGEDLNGEPHDLSIVYPGLAAAADHSWQKARAIVPPDVFPDTAHGIVAKELLGMLMPRMTTLKGAHKLGHSLRHR